MDDSAANAPNAGSLGDEVGKLIESVDAVTRARAADLCARNLSDFQIAGVLMLTYEQVCAIKTTEEYKIKFAEIAHRMIQEQLDRDDGWDGLETKALEGLYDTLKFNKDPKFLLLVAKSANTAERRTKNKSEPKVIDNSQQTPGQTNIIFLSINKTYAEREGNMIDVSARPVQIPLKQSDVPSPKLVEQILGAEKHVQGAQGSQETELERMFRESGVVFDEG